eukprot:6188883-Pleurochrysis_carterae.AAC.1
MSSFSPFEVFGGGRLQSKETQNRRRRARTALSNKYRQHCCVDPNAANERFKEKWEARSGPNVLRGEVNETCSSLGLQETGHPSCDAAF